MRKATGEMRITFNCKLNALSHEEMDKMVKDLLDAPHDMLRYINDEYVFDTSLVLCTASFEVEDKETGRMKGVQIHI